MNNRNHGYLAVVDKDPDSAFGVWFPDVEGCFSAADNQADILPNAVEALEAYLEDADDFPVARGQDEIARLDDVKAALSGGSYLLYVPALIDEGRQVRANISMDHNMLVLIDEFAKLHGLTRSAFLVQAARRQISGKRELDDAY